MTSIEWTGKTWNPLVGCSKISEGCRNCYAINQAYRNAAMAEKMPNPGRLAYYDGLTEKRGDRVEWTGKVNFVPEALEIPIKTRKPTTWFVNSMSDLLHESVTFEQLFRIATVMLQTPQHTYQILTKRPERFWLWSDVLKTLQDSINGAMENPISVNPLSNVWLGVTVENQKAADDRIPLLLQTPAAVRFLSCEPLLEKIDLSEFLGYAIRQASRGDNLSSSSVRQAGNRFRGAHLERYQTRQETRRINEQPISEHQSDVQQSEISNRCPSTSVSTFLRQNSRRLDDQPQRRQQEEQSPTQSGVSDNLGSSFTRNSCTQKESEIAESVGRGESRIETDSTTSSGDSGQTNEGREVGSNSSGLRDSFSDGFKDSERNAMGVISWCILGGESGHSARPCDIEWIRTIVQQCKAAHIPVFVKQLGSKPQASKPYIAGVVDVCHPIEISDRKGGNIEEFPEDLKIRQFPQEIAQC